MLKEKQQLEGQLTSFKLITGEEIIARLDEQRDNQYVLSRPVILVPTERGTAMVPYLLTADVTDEIVLDFSKVIMIAASKKELEAGYIQATTGISTINTGIVR
jgi:hypothetical protein